MPGPHPTQMDYVIVLGASTQGEQATPVFRARILEGVRLYHSGQVKKIILTGGPGAPPQAEVAKTIALEAGVPEENLLVEDKSKNTWENLKFSRELLAGQSQKRVFIVSEPLHLKRALLMAQDLGMEAYPAPTKTSAYKSFWKKFYFTGREAVAYTYYRVKRLFIKNNPA